MSKNSTPVVPTVGMGATGGAGGDRYPYTIVEVSASGKSITVQKDRKMVLSGSVYDGTAVYATLPDTDAHREVYTLRKNGRWIRKGQPIQAHWHAIYPGTRGYSLDPSF